MKILIADDNIQKQRVLRTCIEENFVSSDITQTFSFTTTIKALTSSVKFDIILLDMTMPNYDSKEPMNNDGKMRTLAGQDVITKMAYRGITTPTIIVTQFEVFGRHSSLKPISEIAQELIASYPNIVKGYVLFDLQSELWKTDLIKKITEL
ncbi:TPA: response regulator [Escherichia coli]|uniref:response regulator transcription factor n=1 Tax=Enterobacterales TaxID=91347 RepID=UPI000BB74BC3|nr:MULTISPECIES: response regulator [Enterobacteriaceae]MBJ9831334.1 response regulator [Citrobacter freundii]HEN3231804.1 response regulator [Yersinia enterocolitica]EET9688156.1 response regulator [Escherichia coli]EFP2694584.1 response regulator [Escherichia coli]EHV2483514.1 response regulator [Escherichia coli]